mmetsp:Transcript_37727/g.92730  ORF Transcript_37727/g.92730 Transcript_37727/m.92730 type:complete len:375 (-) Transcript_37727:156-1280(-)
MLSSLGSRSLGLQHAPQLLQHVLHRRPLLARVSPAVLDDVASLSRARERDRRPPPPQHVLPDISNVPSPKRRFTRESFPKRQPEGVHVRRERAALPPVQLRGHIHRRPSVRPRLGRLRHVDAQPKITQLGDALRLVHQHILGLDVPVDYSRRARVQERQRRCHPAQEPDLLLFRHVAPTVEQPPKRPPPAPLKHHAQVGGPQTGAHEQHDVGVADGGERVHLALEVLLQRRVERSTRVYGLLDRNRTSPPHALVQHPEAALCDLVALQVKLAQLHISDPRPAPLVLRDVRHRRALQGGPHPVHILRLLAAIFIEGGSTPPDRGGLCEGLRGRGRVLGREARGLLPRQHVRQLGGVAHRECGPGVRPGGGALAAR